MRDLPWLIVIVSAVLIGLWISNILYDYQVPQYISRKVGHMTGGMGYLLSMFVFKDYFWPVVISGVFCIVLGLAKLYRPQTFRGVGGSGRAKEAIGEVWFPFSSLIVLYFGWQIMHRPEFAILSILFMAWGDAVAGIIRSQVYTKAVKGLWGTLGMFIACCLISWALVTPVWVGIVGAIVATATELACGDVGVFRKIDDNGAIPLTSMAAMSLALFLSR